MITGRGVSFLLSCYIMYYTMSRGDSRHGSRQSVHLPDSDPDLDLDR